MKQSTKSNLLFAFSMILIIGGAIAMCFATDEAITKAEQNYTNNNK